MLGFYHDPIMLEEVLEFLDPQAGGVYVDATLGSGGHFKGIISKINGQGTFIGIDQDIAAIEKVRSEGLPGDVRLVRDNFRNFNNIVKMEGLNCVDGILFDLGVSSYQLDQAKRGFSYRLDAPLDMRMDQRNEISAWDVVNHMPEEKLQEIIREYGEERWAKRIAIGICRQRAKGPIDTTSDLAEIIKRAIPARFRRTGPHPATRTFQAIRIHVNNELEILRPSIEDAVKTLKPGGRICVITFHSLEDRIIKNVFRYLATDCICPRQSILCTCDHEKSVEILTRRPISPRSEEIDQNPRSRSAKLRVAQRV